MTVLGYAGVIGLIWWGLATSGLLLSVVAVLFFLRPHRGAVTTANLPPLTAIVPVKDLDAHFETAQESLFAQNYPGLEIVMTSAEQQSPALDAARRVQKKYPAIASRIVQSQSNVAVSPKLNNLWPAVVQARDDIILTKDSNVLLAPEDVASFVGQLAPDVGLVSTIPVAVEPQSPAAWVEAAIINCYYARMLMLARTLGLGFGCGKIMLFRRSDIERAGGFARLAGALGEDAALAEAVGSLGLRTVLADRVTRQALGSRALRDVWDRQLRWKSIWRAQVPAIFIVSLLGSALLASVGAAFAAPLVGVAPAKLAAATLIGWFLLETLSCLVQGWPLSIWSPFAFLGREVLDLLVWLRALTASEVRWAGRSYRVGNPAGTVQFDANLAPTVPQGAGTNDGL